MRDLHHYLLGFWYSLRDVWLAGFDLLLGRQRRRYDYWLTIHAPVEKVWQLLTAHDLTFERAGIRITEEPLEGVENGFLSRITVAGRPFPATAYQIEHIEPLRELRFRFLPEHSAAGVMIGSDDRIGHDLEALAPALTRVHSYRELTHAQAKSRIHAPTGLRVNGWLIKQKAERGLRPEPALHAQVLAQAGVLAATLASFWWLAGLTDALLLIGIIVLHELGHALAMLMTGVGVRFVTLVPFFGGMAMPKRPYGSEWNHALIAWAGPGFSLVPTIALIAYADSSDSLLAAHAAALFAVINGFNLLPIPPLDGGVMVNALLGALHRNLARAMLGIGALAMLALAVYLQSGLMFIVFLFAALQFVHQISFDLDLQRQSLRWFQWPVVLLALGVTLLAYVLLFFRADRAERRLDAAAPYHSVLNSAGAARDIPALAPGGPAEQL